MTLLELLTLMRKHLKLVIALPLACVLATALVSWAALPNTYTASVSMYVLTKASTASGADGITNTDLTASQMLTNDVATLIKSERVMTDTAKSLQMTSLDDYKVNVTSSTTTRVVTVSVTGESAQSVAIIVNQLAKTIDEVAQEVMDVRSVNVIDEAGEPQVPSGPPRVMYTTVALFAGLFVAMALVVLMDMLNTRVRNPEEIEELLDVPVIGRIPVIKG